MNEFITGLAWLFMVLSVIRFVALMFIDDPRVRIAEALGENPVGEAAVKAILVFLVCVVWLITYYF